MKSKNGITLIALIITIIVMLILVGVTVTTAIKGGLFSSAKQSAKGTTMAREKEQIISAYSTTIAKTLKKDANIYDLQKELDDTVGADKTAATILADGTFNILFKETKHKFNLNNGKVEEKELDNTKMAFFDTGENVRTKMINLAGGDQIQYWFYIANISIDAIKRYEGTPDLSKMTDENIVSWTTAYEAYKQNPNAYNNFVPEGTELCPIYMWFEKSDDKKVRNLWGDTNLTEITNADKEKEVETGTIYWWSESNNVYLNPDSSHMFKSLTYVSDLSGIKGFNTKFVKNMDGILASDYNQSLKDFDDLANWNTSNVTNMSWALGGWCSLENIDGIKNWDTSNVTNMSFMFGNMDVGSSRITDLSALANWNVSNVINMECMFCGCQVTSLSALASWNVSNVTNMSQMFYSCPITDASGINDWDISKVTDFTYMFLECNTHPEFTKVSGTWDESGTFTPSN